MAMVAMVACAVVLMWMVATPHVEAAITCRQVHGALSPCLSYLERGGVVPGPCCNGVRSVNNSARTPGDRQAACRCLKAAAGAISAIKLVYASGLPDKCRVNIRNKISPSTDCSKVN